MPFPIVESEVARTERVIGCRFPDGYRERMMASNGGDLRALGDDWLFHPIEDASDRKRISRTCNHVLRETEQRRDMPGYPEGALCIASNSYGDVLLFFVEQGRCGPEVWRLEHDGSDIEMVAKEFGDLFR